jgi:hypothetical protein
MTFTPTKNRGTATGEKIRTPNIPAMRDAWCALVPAGIDTNASFAESDEQAASLAWQVAGNARLFMEWTNFQPASWQPPTGFQTSRMARVCKWLGGIDKTDMLYRREDALKILLAASDRLKTLDADVFWNTVFTLWHPDEEFGPLTENLEFLPLWDVDDPEPQRAAAAKAAEEFVLYSGLVTYLNTQIGKDLLDLEADPF